MGAELGEADAPSPFTVHAAAARGDAPPAAPKNANGAGSVNGASHADGAASGVIGAAANGGSGGGGGRSIFDIYSRRRKAAFLLVCSLGTCLVPVSDTIYLPALDAVEKDLGTTSTLVATSVAVYMYMVGLGALVFGPTADRFGRRMTLCGTTAAFTALSLVAIFSKNIGMLLALRALQGFVVSSCATTSNAILADIFAPAERGRAMGVAAIPFLVGPVIGPLLGGGLSQSLGWRSTFAALTIAGGLVLLAQLLVLQETHHYYAARRVRAAQGEAAADFLEEIHAPHFDPPYQPLLHLVDRNIAPHALVTVMLFSSMFSCMIVLPIVLSQPPYSFNEAIIGVANGVPFGMGGLLAAPLGGLMADWGARRWPGTPAGRMVYSTAMALAVFPLAAMLFGWGMHFRLAAAVPLLGGFFINWSMTSHMPASMSLISIYKQRYAAAAGGGLHALQFCMAGVYVQVTPSGVAALGVGPWMSLVVGITVAFTLVSAVIVARDIKGAGARGAPGDEEAAGSGKAAVAAAAAAAAPSAPGAGEAASPPASPSKAGALAAAGGARAGSATLSRRSSVEVALEALEGLQGYQAA